MLIRFLFALAGILLLATILPLKNPWQMVNMVRVIHPPLHIDIYPLGLGWGFRISELTAVFALLGGFSFPFLLFSSFRRAFATLKANKPVFFSTILAFEFFAFSMIPVSNDIIHDSKSVFLFLMVGSLAVLFLSIGLAPVILKLFSSRSLKEHGRRGYDIVRRALFDSRPIFFLITLFLTVFALTNLVSAFTFDHIPHVQDSIAQYFQGKIFASGQLTAPEPPQKDFFAYLHMINEGRWYSQYPPGHPFLLMLGILMGIPWIVNPLLGSLTVVALYFLGKELYGERIGRISALLGVLSPFLLFMSSGFMNHTSAMFFFVIFLLFFVKGLRSGKISDGLLAGAGLGMVVNIRPYSAAPLAALFLLFGLFQILKRPRELWKSAAAFVVTASAFTGILLAYNWQTNGSPFLFGFEVLYGPQVLPGFGHAAWGIPHNAYRGVMQTLNNLIGMNKYLFEWPVPSLVFVFLLFAMKGNQIWDYLLIGTFGAVVTAYFFYWFQDWCFGPRFLYEPSALLLILTARGIDRLPGLVELLGFSASIRKIRIATFTLLLTLFGVGYAANLPRHLQHYGDSYWDVNRDVLTAIEKQGITRGIVFTRTNLGGVFPANSPLLDGDLIFARDFGDRNKTLMKLFPGYDAYVAIGSDIQPYKPE